MAKRIVEWDDFTGGYYVGPSATQQPRNTFQGDNVTVAMDDATLIPMYQCFSATLTGTDVTGGAIVNANWTDISKPSELNGLVCFVAKTGSVVYLYAISPTQAVTRYTLSLTGSAADFQLSTPLMIAVPSATTVRVVIAGDTNKLITYLLVANGTTGTAGTVDLTAVLAAGSATRLYGITLWGARMVGWSNNAYLYFSDASNISSWIATNFIIIGYGEDVITSVVPRNFDLIIGKPTGWYSVTGVLNYSATVRQVNNGLGIVNGDPVAEWNNAVIFNTDTGTIGFPVNLYTVNGARVEPLVFQRFTGNVQNIFMAKGPLGVLQVCHTVDDDTDIDGRIWMLNQQSRWSKTVITSATGVLGNEVRYYPTFATQSRSSNWTDPSLHILEYNVTKKSVAYQVLPVASFEPGLNNNQTAAVATVKLVDYMSQVPVSVTDVFVEVENAQLTGGLNYDGDGQLSCTVNTKYPLGDLDLSVGDVSSTTLTYVTDLGTIPGSGTRFLGRMYRFKPDNAGHGFGFEVALTFAGCKVRRVIAILEDHR